MTRMHGLPGLVSLLLLGGVPTGCPTAADDDTVPDDDDGDDDVGDDDTAGDDDGGDDDAGDDDTTGDDDSGDAYAQASCPAETIAEEYDHCDLFIDGIAPGIDSMAIWASGPDDLGRLVDFVEKMRAPES